MSNLASDAMVVVVVVMVVEMMSWITSSLLLTWRILQTFDITQNIWNISQEIVHRWHQMQWWWWWWRWRWNYKQSASNLEVSPDFRHLSKFLKYLSRRWASMANLASDAVVVVVEVEMMSWNTSSLLLTWRILQIFDISQNFWNISQEIVHRWLTWHQMQWWWWWRWRWCPELQAVCF